MAANLSVWRLICKLLLTFILIIPSAHAAETTATQALKAIESQEWDKAYDLAAKTNNPVIAKIYFSRYFQTDNNNGDFKRLAHFIRYNQNWPGIRNIRKQLESKITPLIADTEIIKWFNEYPPLTADGLDHYAAALLRQGLKAKLRRVMGQWWATTLMSREEQKQIYSRYKAYIPLESHRRRFDKLLLDRHYKNARAVAGVLGEGYKELAEARIALAQNKQGVNALINAIPGHLHNDPGLLYERLKWRRKNGLNQGAIEILNQAPPYEKMANPKSWWQERHIIIRRLLEEGAYKRAYHLAIIHKQKAGFAYAQAEWLAGWLALRFEKKPAEAYQRFEALHAKVSTPVSKARAAYWAGRAAEAMKAKDIAKNWYEKAARYQTVFYGQKAGEKIGTHKALQYAKPPPVTAEFKTRFDANPFMQAAKLYHKAGMTERTSDFLWSFIKAEDTPQAHHYAAQIAAKMERYHDVIMIAKDATKKGYFLTLQSYPAMTKIIRQAQASVDPALLHALMRQESQFNATIHSPAGARGLMQLMPATAKQVAGKLNIPHRTSWLTQRPAHNIRLGSAYMEELLTRYDGEYIMAIAAYNAGPGRVDRWIETFGDPRTGHIDPLDWGELIPIYETRNYVQRVTEGLYVYRLLLNDKKL